MRAFAKLHSSHIKNDKVDAKLIAYYLLSGFKTIELSGTDEIKDLVRLYYKTLKNLTRYKFMFQNQINIIFPELEEHCYLAKTFVIANMLLKYPRPEDITSVTPEELQYELTKNLTRGSRYTLEYAKKLQELARNSVGIKAYPVSCFKYTIMIMLYYEDIIKDITCTLREIIKKTPYYPLLEEFGHSIIGLSTIVGEVGDVRRFPNHKKFVRYIGYDVSEKQSGKMNSVNCYITKKGNRFLRAVLYTKVLAHIAYKTEIGEYYQKLLDKGKHPKQAIVAAARKLAVRTYYDMLSCHPETNIIRKPLSYKLFEKKRRRGTFENAEEIIIP
jgi:hypothetical protein